MYILEDGREMKPLSTHSIDLGLTPMKLKKDGMKLCS